MTQTVGSHLFQPDTSVAVVLKQSNCWYGLVATKAELEIRAFTTCHPSAEVDRLDLEQQSGVSLGPEASLRTATCNNMVDPVIMAIW